MWHQESPFLYNIYLSIVLYLRFYIYWRGGPLYFLLQVLFQGLFIFYEVRRKGGGGGHAKKYVFTLISKDIKIMSLLVSTNYKILLDSGYRIGNISYQHCLFTLTWFWINQMYLENFRFTLSLFIFYCKGSSSKVVHGHFNYITGTSHQFPPAPSLR